MAEVYTICRACAVANGAVWREGHMATFWNGTCEACGQPRCVCDVDDWSWPLRVRPKAVQE